MPINATIGTLPTLPDGEYQGECGGRPVHFRIHTVSTGILRNQRIVKRLENRVWKGFATLRIDEARRRFTEIYVWRSMEGNLRPDEVRGVNRFLRIWFQRMGTARPESFPDVDDLIISICPETPFATPFAIRGRDDRVSTRTESRNTNLNPNPYPDFVAGVEDVRWRDGSRVTRTPTPAMSFWTPSEVR